MGLFRSKKRGPSGTEPLAMELFRIGMVQRGMSESDMESLERKVFGMTFAELLNQGYEPTHVIEDESAPGVYWSAIGKVERGS